MVRPLASATAVNIAVGAAGTTEFASRKLADGEMIDLDAVQVEVWSTPGHTPESISLIVRPSADSDPAALLTGDTLFIGDVGRADLLVAADVPAEYLGAQLYDWITRLAALPAATLFLPVHGAGSACGKAPSSDTVSTIGAQRTTNCALAPRTREQFVEIVTEGRPAPPRILQLRRVAQRSATSVDTQQTARADRHRRLDADNTRVAFAGLLITVTLVNAAIVLA